MQKWTGVAVVLILIGCGGNPLVDRLTPYMGQDALCSELASENGTLNVQGQIKAADIHDSTATWAYVLEEGEEAIFSRAWLSENSTMTMDIQYFIFSMDNVGVIALDYILRAADRGVQVRILVDDFMLDVQAEDVEALSAHPNVALRIYNPTEGKNTLQKVYRAASDFKGFNQRMHNKTLVVDGRVAITGGRNMADEYFDYDQAYNFRDRDVLLVGPGAGAVQASFETFWSHPLAVEMTFKDKGDNKQPQPFFDAVHAYSCDPENFWPEVRALIEGVPEAIPRLIQAGRLHRLDGIRFVSDLPGKNSSDSFSGGGASTDALLELVSKATTSIAIQSPYLVLTELGLSVFSDAVERGVEVSILTNSLSSTDNLEAFNGYQRIRKPLLESGVKVFEYRPDAKIRKKLITAEKQKRSGYFPTFGLHAKSMVVDHQTVVIGTFNLDPRSANLNTECVAIMSSAAMADQVEGLMLEELAPENAWETTTSFNPDAQAGFRKQWGAWLRRIVPASLL